jgi:hypothetical protein
MSHPLDCYLNFFIAYSRLLATGVADPSVSFMEDGMMHETKQVRPDDRAHGNASRRDELVVQQDSSLIDNRSAAVRQHKLADAMTSSPRTIAQRAIADTINQSPRVNSFRARLPSSLSDLTGGCYEMR